MCHMLALLLRDQAFLDWDSAVQASTLQSLAVQFVAALRI